MEYKYAKVIVKGSPISKSNFKLFNIQGRAILPYNSGKYHDRYALYEEEIAYESRVQNPGLTLRESLIAILKVYYKSEKRHPDTNNITKSIFDGIEKSGLIVNDAQVRRLIIEEFYDKENPRFELELFAESSYSMNYSIEKKCTDDIPVNYSEPPNRKSPISTAFEHKALSKSTNKTYLKCQFCGKTVTNDFCISANSGTMLICKDCFKKLF
ncbi:MAG: rusA [Clostridiaceae bacterium]|jgi:Holliday junction resolvase RusA-like endonuclease|nr:rusA [Clostridiaceae bacterium]